MSVVFFVDPCCPKPYDRHSLEAGGLGGTEATVVRIAEALAREGVESYVVQHNRTAGSDAKGARAFYVSPGHAVGMRKPDAVVVLRDPDSLVPVRRQFPEARLYLWLHDFGSAEFVRAIVEHCRSTHAEPIAVSHWHAAHLSEDEESNRQIRPRVIYNPIDDTLPGAPGAFDENKLVFFSSPKKGLARTLTLFEQARATINPAFKLFLMNPGYDKSSLAAHPNVVDLGVLSHARAIEQVRGALCVFYPNDAIPETFGLVFAEANAVGTPVITLDIGAASEILCDPAEVCRSVDEVLPRLESWYRGARPTVRHEPGFLTSNVVRSWLALLR